MSYEWSSSYELRMILEFKSNASRKLEGLKALFGRRICYLERRSNRGPSARWLEYRPNRVELLALSMRDSSFLKKNVMLRWLQLLCFLNKWTLRTCLKTFQTEDAGNIPLETVDAEIEKQWRRDCRLSLRCCSYNCSDSWTREHCSYDWKLMENPTWKMLMNLHNVKETQQFEGVIVNSNYLTIMDPVVWVLERPLSLEKWTWNGHCFYASPSKQAWSSSFVNGQFWNSSSGKEHAVKP